MSEYITTYTGQHFEPTNPDPELIRIEDIAHALSMICRGNGHVKTFWSVGQHCICCAREAAARGLSNRMVLACLLHDASECYMSDVPTPFKNELPEYQEQEEDIRNSVLEMDQEMEKCDEKIEEHQKLIRDYENRKAGIKESKRSLDVYLNEIDLKRRDIISRLICKKAM